MKKKLLYTAPEAELLVVQSEGFICQSGEFTIGGFEEDGILDAVNFTSIL